MKGLILLLQEKQELDMARELSLLSIKKIQLPIFTKYSPRLKSIKRKEKVGFLELEEKYHNILKDMATSGILSHIKR